MTWVKWEWILVLLLVLPMATAQTASGLQFTASELGFNRNGAPVTSVSGSYPRVATMTFKVTGSFSSMVIDVSELGSQNSWKTLRPGTNEHGTCSGTGIYYSCQVDNVIIQPSGGSGSVHLNITSGNKSARQSLGFSFTVDNTQPTVQSMSINGCTSNCYIGSGQSDLEIVLSDSVATFHNGFIFYYSAGRGPFMVNSCNGMTCNGKVSSNCQHGQPVEVKLGSYNGVPSQDDAGNPVHAHSSTYTCDRVDPIIKNITVETSDGRGFLVEGDSAELIIEVEDEIDMIAFADFSSVGDAVVEQACEGNICRLPFTVGVPGYKRATIDVNVKDIAGNLVTQEYELEILEKITNGSASWQFSVTKVAPSRINARILAYFNRKAYVLFKLVPSSADLEVGFAELDNCRSNTGLADVRVSNLQSNNPYAAFELESGFVNDGKVTINCSLKIYGKVGKKVYVNPDVHNFSISIKLTNTEDIPQMVENEIARTKENVQEIEDTYSQVNGIIETVTSACQAAQSIDTAIQLYCQIKEVIECKAALASAGTTTAAAEADKQFCDKVLSKSTMLLKGKFGTICRFMTCDTKVNTFVRDKMLSLPGVKQMTAPLDKLGLSAEQFYRPENSIYLSALSLCLPGVVSNLDKKNSIECEYLRCLEEDVPVGLPVAECRKNRNYQECKYEMGGILNAFPWTAITSGVGDYVQSILRNPLSVVLLAVSKIYECGPAPVCTAHPVCTGVFAADAIYSMINILDGIKDMQNFLGGKTSEDYCGKILGKPTPYLIDPRQYVDSMDTFCDQNGCFSGSIGLGHDGTKGLTVYTVKNFGLGPLKFNTHYTKINDQIYRVKKDKSGSVKLISLTPEKSKTVANQIESINPTTLPANEVIVEGVGDISGDVLKDLEEEQKKYVAAGFEGPDYLVSIAGLIQTLSQIQDILDGQEPGKPMSEKEQAVLGQLIDKADEQASSLGGFDDPVSSIKNNLEKVTGTKILKFGKIEIEIVKGTIKDIKKFKKDLRKEANKKTKEVLNKEAGYNAYAWSQWGAALRFASAVSAASSLFLPDDSFGAYSEFVDDKLGKIFNFQDEYIEKMCALDELDRGSAGAGTVLTFVDDRIKTAIHVEGSKEKDIGSSAYVYIATALVTPPKQGSVSFAIYIKGEGEKLLDSATVNANGTSYSRPFSNPFKFNDTKNYETICIRFEENLKNKYDQVILVGNELCNEIIESPRR